MKEWTAVETKRTGPDRPGWYVCLLKGGDAHANDLVDLEHRVVLYHDADSWLYRGKPSGWESDIIAWKLANSPLEV